MIAKICKPSKARFILRGAQLAVGANALCRLLFTGLRSLLIISNTLHPLPYSPSLFLKNWYKLHTKLRRLEFHPLD